MAASTAASEAKISEQQLSISNSNINTCAILNNSDFNCTNCDIKFDSESSLRVHLQVSPESFEEQSEILSKNGLKLCKL